MMRTWTRAERELACGYCDRRIARGLPIMKIQLRAVTHPLIRCSDCAGEPVATNLPPLAEPTTASRLERFEEIHAAAMRANTRRREWMPYRDPGEDD